MGLSMKDRGSQLKVKISGTQKGTGHIPKAIRLMDRLEFFFIPGVLNYKAR